MDNAISAGVGVLSCNRAMDQMDFTLAKKIGDDLLKTDTGLLEIHKHLLTNELIYCELIAENNKKYISSMYSKKFRKFIKSMSNYPAVMRISYTYELLANENEIAANKILDKFEKVAKTYPHACEIAGERELIEYAKQLYFARFIDIK